MDQGVKTEHEINRCIRSDGNRPSVVLDDLHVRGVSESLIAGFYALWRYVDSYQTPAVLAKELSPATKSRGDFQNRGSRKKHLDARVNDILPKILGSSPRFRPLVSGS